MKAKLLAALLAASALPLMAQDAQKEIERYRQLLADGNPPNCSKCAARICGSKARPEECLA